MDSSNGDFHTTNCGGSGAIMIYYTEDEARETQERISTWRDSVGALDTKGWYPYKSEVVTETEQKDTKTQIPQSKQVTTQFKRKA